MQGLSIATLMMAALFVTGCDGDGDAATADEGVDRTLEAWATALREGDLEAVASLVTEDAEFWTHGEPELVGREALVEAFRPFVEAYELDQRWDEEERWIGSEWAFLRGTEENVLTPRGEGETMVVRQRAFSMLRKGDDGRWRFARGMTNLAPGMDGEGGGS